MAVKNANAKNRSVCVTVDMTADGNFTSQVAPQLLNIDKDGNGTVIFPDMPKGNRTVEILDRNDPASAQRCGVYSVNVKNKAESTPTPTPKITNCRNIGDPCIFESPDTPLCYPTLHECKNSVVVQKTGSLNTPVEVEQTIDLSAKGCGVVGKKCCTFEPGAVPEVPQLELNAEASQFTGVMDMAKSLTKGLAEKVQEITFNDYNNLTNGRLCFDKSVPEITTSSGKSKVENLYLVTEKLYRISDSTPENIDDNQKVEKSSVTSCDCVPAEALCADLFDDNGQNCNMRFLCKNVPGDYNVQGSQQRACVECMVKGKMWTVLGCIDIDLKSFVQNQLFGIGLGFAGISAFLCIIYGSFMLQISSGDPEKIKQSQELITSCITGLIVIIFSVFILRIIGVDLLKIPGLGG
jgi:hypothetical protein